MKAIKVYEQYDGRTVGVFQDGNRCFVALTRSKSKTFETFESADEWLSKHL